MAITKRFRDRGANITVTAAGEVLFMPGGQVHGWTRRFGNRAATFSAEAAPTNKRPRWGHYGKPLKETISSSPARFYGNGIDKQLVHVAVGSSSPHAYYVDQGTKDFMAKILPPWTRNSPSLYEHTWRVPQASHVNGHGEKVVEWEEVGPIHVRGQRAQHFFDRGLDRAFKSMIRRAFQVPTDPKVTAALRTWPTGLENFLGNTRDDGEGGAFRASLAEWRAWRDEAWAAKRILGAGYNSERHRREMRSVKSHIKKGLDLDARRAASAERSRRYRERQRELKSATHPKKERLSTKQRMARNADKAKFLSAMTKRYGAGNVDVGSLEYRNGYWYVLVVSSRSASGNATYKEVRAKAKS